LEGSGMVEYVIIAILAFTLIMLLVKHLSVKGQIKNIDKQLREDAPRRRSVSIELFDKDIRALTLIVNHIIEEYSQLSLEKEKEAKALKNSIADISHDMRTPLTSIIGYLQLLGKGDIDGEGQQHLSIALEKSQYLRKLLTDFHELAVLSVKETAIELEKVDLAGIVSDIILDNANEFAHKGISPIFEQSDIPVFIIGEMKALQRAIQNLVSNCLKYSNDDVTFTIIENDTISLIIENSADNLDSIDHNRLFDRFYKGDTSRNVQGAGLGLPITRLLVERMGGEISVDATTETFSIHLNFAGKM